MNSAWLLERMRSYGAREALAGTGPSTTYGDLLARSDQWTQLLDRHGVERGSVVAFDGDFRERTVALMLALLMRGCIAVPLASTAEGQRDEFLSTSQAEYLISGLDVGDGIVALLGKRNGHPLLDALALAGRPGIILFSSGSTGQAKAVLHDFDRLLERFVQHRPPLRILSFLLLDHIGGLNTLFAGLAHGGTVVSVADRRPESVCRAIAKHLVEVLPTSPTFLNLMLLSGAYRQHDLSNLRLITYGTEPMPASTLERIHRELPGIRLQQTYGLSELGILRSKSRDDGSLWMRVGGEGYETKIIEGILKIRARTAMVGYLNAESPFDADGWFDTQDAVEQDGDWIRILGRTSEQINVGGQKVFPAEVESILLELENIIDATIHAEPHPIIGQCIVARVNLREYEDVTALKLRIRRHCHGRLAPYMIPVKVEIVHAAQHGARCKRVRRSVTPSNPQPHVES